MIHLERLECKKRDFSVLKPLAITSYMQLFHKEIYAESKGVAPQMLCLKKLDS